MESTGLTTSLRETLDVVEATGDAYEPLTTNEVTERLDVGRRSTYERLKRLVDQERLRTKKVGARGRVWWRPPPAKAASETGDGAQRPPVRPNVEFRALVDTVEEYAIFQFDEEGYITTWNPGAEHVKGYEPKEIIGEHFSTFYTDDAVAEGVPGKTLEAAAAEGEIVNEGWRVRADGSRFWANVTITAIRDDDGELLGFAMVTRDMTERREREQQLRRERDLIERVLDTVPVGVGVASSEGEILRVNERSTDLLGIVDDDGAYDLNDYKLYDTDGSPISQEEQPVTRVVETGNAVREQQCQIEHSDGERRWLSVHAAPLEDEDGQVDRVVVVGEDISPLREQANRLERQRDDLETELAEVFDRVDDAFYAIDEEWRFTHVNDRGEEFLGRTEGELLGRVVWEVFPEAKGTMGEEAFRRAVKTQESVTYEECFEPLDRWFEVRAYPSESGLSVYFRDITERKQRERELERYEQLVETVWDGVAALDDDDRFTMVNDAFCEMAGYDREELLGEPVTRIHSEEVNEEAAELNEEVQRGERDVATLEFQLLTADGETVPVEGRFGPYKHGDTSGRVGVVRDITERKEHERELDESRRRLQTLVEHFPNGAVALVDEDLRYVTVGGTPLREAGKTVDELEGQHLESVLPTELSEVLVPKYEAALNGDTQIFEQGLGERFITFRIVPVRDDDGEVFAAAAMSQDITDRKERERELQEAKTQLEAATEAGAVGTWEWHIPEDEFVAGPSFARTFGVDPEAAREGVSLERFLSNIHEDDRDRIERKIDEAVESCGEYEEEYRVENANGKYRWVLAKARVVCEDGDPVTFPGAVTDVTERKQYERELEEAERRYRTLVENYPNGAIILFDEDLEYLIAGGEAFEGLDVSIEDLEGDTIPEHLPAEFTDTFEPRFRAVFEGQVSEFEFEFNDQIRQFQVVPVRDGSGSIFAGLTISQDVTQHREHERELKRQREQLEAVNNLNGVVQDITDAVVAQSTREEIEDAVVGGLADAESFSFAWIGEVDGVTREVELRTEAGVDGYLDGVTITTDLDDERSNGPTAQALLTGEPQVAQDVQTNPGHDPWRDHIEAYDIRSSAAIPIVHEGATHGVLNVYADRPYAFDDTERQVLTQLGEVVGHAIAAVERKQALMSDEVVELEFRIPGVFQALEIEASSEGQITHDQAVPTGDGSYLLYGTATDDAWPAVGSIIDAVPHWESVQDLGQRGDRHRFEVTLTEPPVLSVVASRGGYVQEAVIEDGDYHMTVHLPPTVDNRSIAEAVEDAYPMADLVAQRQFSRTDDTRARFERLLHEELTERQRAAVEVAFHAGFFEWPRESDGEAVSESLGVSPPTFHQHLRKAERKVFEALLKGPVPSDEAAVA
ncbi:PAS domain S-box protein [Haloplanus salinus]|uniref:histidine kinase n=1 Tax=Haloplanus salinus TaxID=1126245 RepID=A0A368N4K3_9EURY|nr:PAS domain S-box protein [Haloplanus salinus]